MKTVPIYLLLVGLPLAVLVPVLEAGRSLAAPPAVAGEWRSSPDAELFRITQSGQFLGVERIGGWGRRAFRGRLRGIELVTSPDDAGCGSARLHVRFGAGARPDSASAWLEGDARGCAPAPVTLRRAAQVEP